MKIEVTERHVEQSVQLMADPDSWLSFNCPVALAMSEALGKTVQVAGEHYFLPSDYDGKSLPVRVSMYISEYDVWRLAGKGKFEKTISFRIKAPKQ